MSEDNDSKRGYINGAAPVSFMEVQKLLEDHRDYLDHRMTSMSGQILQGFDTSSNKVVVEISGLRRDLVPSATNQNKIETKVIMPIIYTLCSVITGLVVWFTGIKPFIPNLVESVKPQQQAVPANEHR